MSLGDISFIAAFVIFPLVIVALSVWALRTLSRRERRPLARFSADSPAESTQEMPIAQTKEPRDWTAAVQTKAEAASGEDTDSASAQTQSFKVPTYRGRSTGVVRRVVFRSRQEAHPQEPSTLDISEPE